MPSPLRSAHSRHRRSDCRSLYNNNISALDAGAFASLPLLQSLRLDGNQLKTLPLGAFSTLRALTTLQLNSNLIATVSSGALGNLPLLSSLRLDANRISSLPSSAVGFLGLGLPALSVLCVSSHRHPRCLQLLSYTLCSTLHFDTTYWCSPPRSPVGFSVTRSRALRRTPLTRWSPSRICTTPPCSAPIYENQIQSPPAILILPPPRLGPCFLQATAHQPVIPAAHGGLHQAHEAIRAVRRPTSLCGFACLVLLARKHAFCAAPFVWCPPSYSHHSMSVNSIVLLLLASGTCAIIG